MAVSEKRGCAPIAVSAAFVLLPAAYVLSIGPVFRLLKDGNLHESWGNLYLPIVWLCNHIEPVGRMVRWYLSLFGC